MTAIYMLPRLAIYNTYMRSFQCKILNNVLVRNKKLHTFWRKPSLLCSFCNLYNETPLHIFYELDAVKCLSVDLVQCLQNNLILPTLTPQAAILGILESTSNGTTFENNKVFIITFYLCLSYICLSPEKKVHKFK